MISKTDVLSVWTNEWISPKMKRWMNENCLFLLKCLLFIWILQGHEYGWKMMIEWIWNLNWVMDEQKWWMNKVCMLLSCVAWCVWQQNQSKDCQSIDWGYLAGKYVLLVKVSPKTASQLTEAMPASMFCLLKSVQRLPVNWLRLYRQAYSAC